MDANMKWWEGNPIKKINFADGEYWVPVCSSKNFVHAIDIFPNSYWDDQKRTFGTGLQKLNIRLEYNYNFTDVDDWDYEEQSIEVPIGVYRTGNAEPLWTGFILLREGGAAVETIAEMKLCAGPHFILMCNVGMDERSKDFENMRELASLTPFGLRYDFKVYPSGKELVHPKITDVKLEQRPFSEWKSSVMDDYIESRTMTGQLCFEELFDLDNNFLSLDVFDESRNWRGWSNFANRDGQLDIIGYYPILDGNYLFVIRHNDTPVTWGRFVCLNGVCTISELSEWHDDNILADVLPRYNKARNLVFDNTVYGQQLKLLSEVWYWDDVDDMAQWDDLEKKFFRLSGVE